MGEHCSGVVVVPFARESSHLIPAAMLGRNPCRAPDCSECFETAAMGVLLPISAIRPHPQRGMIGRMRKEQSLGHRLGWGGQNNMCTVFWRPHENTDVLFPYTAFGLKAGESETGGFHCILSGYLSCGQLLRGCFLTADLVSMSQSSKRRTYKFGVGTPLILGSFSSNSRV